MVVSTSNLSPAGEKLPGQGEFVCSSLEQIVLQGRVAVRHAVKAARGEKTIKQVSTPALLVTRESLSEVDMREVTAPADYRSGQPLNSAFVSSITVFAPRAFAWDTMSSVPPGPSPASPFHSAMSVTCLPPKASALCSIQRLLRCQME